MKRLNDFYTLQRFYNQSNSNDMRKLLLSGVFAAMAFGGWADVVTPNQALDRVMGNAGLMSAGMQQSRPQLVATRSVDNQPAVYVFSLDSDKGYIVLPADDEATPMLGYSDSGKFDAASINPTMQWWLDEYAAEIKWLRENPSPDRYLSAPATARQAIAPMVKTVWNQSEPFNNMCPANGNRRCVTGCVATAMAQIVNYHKLPAGDGTGSASVTYNGTTYTFDYANESFDWDNMLDSYNGSYTSEQANAVAKLMYACGVGVDMSYGTGASAAATSDVVGALVNHFGFDKGARVFTRSYYTLSDWNDLVYNQLKDYGPVQVSGRNDGGGHSFVCDGYNAGDFFHINWGWGGASDGYFKLTALDPASQGIGGSSAGYSSGQYIIGNICAPRADSQPYYSMYVGDALGASTDKVTLGAKFNLTGGFYNSSASTLEGSLGYMLEFASGKGEIYVPIRDINLEPRYGYGQLPIRLPASLAEGSYRLVPLWKRTTDQQWRKFDIPIVNPQYINVRVEGNEAYLTVPASVKLQADVKSFNTPVFEGKPFELTLTLYNDFDTEYLGNVFAVLFSNDGQSQVGAAGSLMVDVMPGETMEVSYLSMLSPLEDQTITPGDYLLAFADEQGRLISHGYSVTVQEAPAEQGTISVSSFRVKDAESVDAMKLEFTADVTCTKGYFIGQLRAYVFSASGGSSSLNIASPMLYIPEGETQHVTFAGAIPSLTVGNRYMTCIFNDGNQLTAPAYFTVGSVSGVESADADNADNEIVAREVYDMSGRAVSGNLLKNGMYIVRERHADGTYTTGKILVK